MSARIIRGPLLNPQRDGSVEYYADGALVSDETGEITFVGNWVELLPQFGSTPPTAEVARGILSPPFLDAHIHIPQHPIRGRFAEGIADNPPEGRLLAGLNRNVFPAEGKFADIAYARQTIAEFARDTLSHGVVGGAAYATVHADAADAALEQLHRYWSVGLVLMNQHCPEYLRNNESVLTRIGSMAQRFGRRAIVTDRFAVAVDSMLRRLACAEAERFGLRTQTHLNEQVSEKRLVEQTLYPTAGSYTDVYLKDGLLDHHAILAHCIHMSDGEFQTVAAKQCVIAHCPTSNTLLGSGIMPLDRVEAHGIDWAICTDVGASPTTSMLNEMAQFVKVHAGRSSHATPSAALYRATLAPARILGLDHEIGTFVRGMPLSFIEIDAGPRWNPTWSADEVIAECLLNGRTTTSATAALESLSLGRGVAHESAAELEHDVRETSQSLESNVLSVTLAGKKIWQR